MEIETPSTTNSAAKPDIDIFIVYIHIYIYIYMYIGFLLPYKPPNVKIGCTGSLWFVVGFTMFA